MKKQITHQLNKFIQITIILSLLLMVGCMSEEEIRRAKKDFVPLIDISAPDLVNPLSMSPRAGVNPNPKYQEVSRFSARLWEFGAPGRFHQTKRIPKFIQTKMSEGVNNSEKIAIKDIEINFKNIIILLWSNLVREVEILVDGSVVELQ